MADKAFKRKRVSFTAFINTGHLIDTEGNEFWNACLFVAFMQYLLAVRKDRRTVTEIRRIAKFPGTKECMLDISKRGHEESIINLVKFFNVQIVIYYANQEYKQPVANKWIYSSGNKFYGNDVRPNDRVHIIAYGNHFELITKIDGKNLYQNINPYGMRTRDYRPSQNAHVPNTPKTGRPKRVEQGFKDEPYAKFLEKEEQKRQEAIKRDEQMACELAREQERREALKRDEEVARIIAREQERRETLKKEQEQRDAIFARDEEYVMSLLKGEEERNKQIQQDGELAHNLV